MKKLIIICCLLIAAIIINAQQTDLLKLSGPYLGQKPPGTIPEVFAPSFFAPHEYVRDAAFTPDGKEFLFTSFQQNQYSIMHTVLNSTWSIPTIAFFSGKYDDFEPCISLDGQRLFFASKRPSETKLEMVNDIDIWYIEKVNGKWSEPKLLDCAINTKCMEYYPSIALSGNIYFGRNDEKLTRGDIYFSKYTNSGFQKSEKLPEVVNLPNTSFNACIAPDEGFLIFSSYIQSDSTWHSDLFISFQKQLGNWDIPLSLGNKINTLRDESSPFISHDGKYLFYSSSEKNKSSIYWVSARIIEELRPKE